jgi:chemotaxis-related protein WspD
MTPTPDGAPVPSSRALPLGTPGIGDCWNRIGVSGDRSCPELIVHIHCRNCPVFAAAARTFFDRPAPEGYLDEWGRWLAESDAHSHGNEASGSATVDALEVHRSGTSMLIFRLSTEWLALPTETVAEVITPKPVHRVPHRSNQILSGIVTFHGQVTLCISLHGLLGVDVQDAAPHMVVLRDTNHASTWVFPADEVLGVSRVPRSYWQAVPSTLVNPTVGFSQAIISWDGRSIGLLDERRIFAALAGLGN